MAGGAQKGEVYVPAYASENLYNEDLAPLKEQTWGSYNIFAFWMSDVHSVGGYVTAGSLFALGLASWQVLVALLVGIVIVYVLLQPGGQAQPVDRRAVPGDLPRRLRRARRQHPGHHPRPDRGRLVRHPDLPRLGGAGSSSCSSCPGLAPYADVDQHGFLGLSALGWVSFAMLWVAAGRRVLAAAWRRSASSSTSAGPAVYVVMFAALPATWSTRPAGATSTSTSAT